MILLDFIGGVFVLLGLCAVVLTPFRGGSTQAVLGAFAIAIGTVMLVV